MKEIIFVELFIASGSGNSVTAFGWDCYFAYGNFFYSQSAFYTGRLQVYQMSLGHNFKIGITATEK